MLHRYYYYDVVVAILSSTSSTPTTTSIVLIREADTCSVNMKFTELYATKIYYCAHKSLPLVPFLIHVNSVNALSSYFHKIHFNIIILSASWFSKWSVTFRLSESICTHFESYSACYKLCPFHPFLCHHSNFDMIQMDQEG
jgi:hypothetical protein